MRRHERSSTRSLPSSRTTRFGGERGGAFRGVVEAIYQGFGGQDLYPTVQEKAANLLYLVVEDHPLFDGNKRSYDDYVGKVSELLQGFPLGVPIVGESAQKRFIALFSAILRLQNILSSFDDFAGHEILTERQGQDYRGVYLDLYADFRRGEDAERESINDEVVFEIELIKQVEINVDYILMLVQKYRDERGNGDDREIRAQISRAIDASPTLRNKADLIEDFVDSVSLDGAVDEDWRAFISVRREMELDLIIRSENLRPDETRLFVESSFRDGALRTTGTAITAVLPAASRFVVDGGHGEKKQRVIVKLENYFERFSGLTPLRG